MEQTDLKILYYHVPNIKEYMKPTAALMEYFKTLNFEVVDIPTPPGQTRMYDGLVENWMQDDIVIFGQDNTCTLEQLLDLACCKYPVCAIPCIVWPRTTALPYLCLNQMDKDMKPYLPHETPEYGYIYVGTGISKVTLEMQKKIGDISGYTTWHHQSFDTNLSLRSRQAGCEKFHLHYPLHKHWKEGDVYEPRV